MRADPRGRRVGAQDPFERRLLMAPNIALRAFLAQSDELHHAPGEVLLRGHREGGLRIVDDHTVIRPVAGQNDDYVANAIGYAAIELVYWFGRRLVPYSHYQLACLSLSSIFDRLRLGERVTWWVGDVVGGRASARERASERVSE